MLGRAVGHREYLAVVELAFVRLVFFDRGAGLMGLAVSADEKKILYGRAVTGSADLMMIENFR